MAGDFASTSPLDCARRMAARGIRKQTHASLRDSAIEEAYEVAEAIDENDPDHLAEELGDLVLHVAMQAQIAEEAGHIFDRRRLRPRQSQARPPPPSRFRRPGGRYCR